MHREKGYWTKENCYNEALKHSNRTSFYTYSSGAYGSSYKNGWLDEVCSHMEILGNLRKRLVYVYEFSDNSVYVGITCNESRRNNQHLNLFGSVFEHIKKTGLMPIKKIISEGYIYVGSAQQLEYDTVEKYKLDNWNILNKVKTGGLGSNIIKWDKETCRKIALTCSSRVEFSKVNSSAYISARKNGWLDEICEHMVWLQRPVGYWTYEKCKEAAKNYTNRFDFSHKCSHAYLLSTKNGWLDEFIPLKINKKIKELV